MSRHIFVGGGFKVGRTLRSVFGSFMSSCLRYGLLCLDFSTRLHFSLGDSRSCMFETCQL